LPLPVTKPIVYDLEADIINKSMSEVLDSLGVQRIVGAKYPQGTVNSRNIGNSCYFNSGI